MPNSHHTVEVDQSPGRSPVRRPSELPSASSSTPSSPSSAQAQAPQKPKVFRARSDPTSAPDLGHRWLRWRGCGAKCCGSASFRRLSAPRVLTGSVGLGIRAGLGEFVGPIAEQEPAEEGGGWSAAPPGRCPEHEEVGRVRTLNHIPGTGLVHR